MSLGGEFGWGLALKSTGESSKSIQGGSDVVTDAGSSMFGIDTDNAGGAINLNFYF